MKMKDVPTSPAHEAAFQDLCMTLKRHGHLQAHELLAIAANFLGKLIAMQDQRLMTPDMAMKIVTDNMERGNKQAIAALTNTKGSA